MINYYTYAPVFCQYFLYNIFLSGNYSIFTTFSAISSKFPFSNLFTSIFSWFSRLSVIKKVLTPNLLTTISSNVSSFLIIKFDYFISSVQITHCAKWYCPYWNTMSALKVVYCRFFISLCDFVYYILN